MTDAEALRKGNRVVDGLSVYWKYIRSSRTAVHACSCRDVGAGGNGSRLSAHGHGTWGMATLQDAGCQAATGTVLKEFGKARLPQWKKLLGTIEKTGASWPGADGWPHARAQG